MPTRSVIAAVAGFVTAGAAVFAQMPPAAPPAGGSPAGAPPAAAAAAPALSPFDQLTAGAKTGEGLFRVHLKDDHLYAELTAAHLNRPMIWPVAVSRGIGTRGLLGGMTLNFENEWVMEFRRVGDRIHVVRKNVRFRARPGTPAAQAVERAYTDSTIAALRVITTNPRTGAAVVDFADLFLSDLAGLGVGLADRSLSTFHRVKSYPENLEIDVSLVFRGAAGPGAAALTTVPDPRGITVGVHWSLSLLPFDGYRPRVADPRVGYFLSAVKDYTRDTGDTSFVRYVNRWRLEKVDPAAKLSEPKKPIKFWIERSWPYEYRRFVREGILEWNKAFERIGFANAIEVRQQDEKDDWDPEDIRYNTIRWITSSAAFAMGPSRCNPLTGEILDADIIFDADMVRFDREEYQLMFSSPAQLLGYDEKGPLHMHADCPQCGCHMAHGMRRELMIGLAALEARGLWKPGEPVPVDYIGAAIKHTIMHEVGHTLGLRHNFKASSIYSLDSINDPKNKDRCPVGSVMDYVPLNIAPKGRPQGPFFPHTIGPYDYWAIEYGYAVVPAGPDPDSERPGLNAIAGKGAQFDLAFAPDEDTYRVDSDPNSNTWDIGDDPLEYGRRRIAVVRELFENLPDRVTGNGEGYQTVRRAFSQLLHSQALSANFAAKLVGGHSMHRDHKGDPNARAPFVPVSAARQRAAMQYLREQVFADGSYGWSPALLARLAPARWWHWGTNPMQGELTFPLHGQVLMVQSMALSQLYSPTNLRRLQEGVLLAPADADVFTLSEMFRSTTDGIWNDVTGAIADRPFTDQRPFLSSFRRSLQREHVETLARILLPAVNVPADGRSLARLQLRRIAAAIDIEFPGKLKAEGRKNTMVDDVSDAHLQDVRERVRKLLEAGVVIPAAGGS
jgi:hypothetical protein